MFFWSFYDWVRFLDWFYGPSVSIAPAGEEDASALALIHRDGFEAAWSADEFDKLLRQKSTQTLLARTALSAATEGPKVPAGFVMVRMAGDEAEILSIAVARNQRRHGIGRLLLDAMLRLLYAERVRHLFLEVAADNEAALALYRRLGFRKVGERKNYYRRADGGEATSAFVMRRDVWAAIQGEAEKKDDLAEGASGGRKAKGKAAKAPPAKRSAGRREPSSQ